MRDTEEASYSLKQAKSAVEVAQSFLMSKSVEHHANERIRSYLMRECSNLIQGFEVAIESLRIPLSGKD